MNIELSTNAAEVSKTLRFLFAEQIPFATSKALNTTAKDAQRDLQAGMRERFFVRRPQFFLRAIKIKPFSTKRRLEAQILVEPPGGQARADIVTRHEKRGRRRPRGGRALAVPIEARRRKIAVISKEQRPAAFQLRLVSNRGGVEIWKGRRRTFMIRRPDGSGVILQRTGPGRTGTFAGTRILYRLKPTTRIEPRLEFYETVRRVVERRFPENFSRAFREAVRTAK